MRNENDQQLEETLYHSFIPAVRSAVKREEYLNRLAYFMSYVGIAQGNLEDRCNAFGRKARNDMTWLTRNVVRYLHKRRQRVEKKEISASTLWNYIKPY